MRCLSDIQMKLYLTFFGYSEQEKGQIEAHMKSCKQCSTLKEKYRKQMAEALARSRKRCHLVQDHLANYIHDGIQVVEDIHIADHLKYCEVCRYYYEKVKETMSYEEAQSLEDPLSEKLESRIKRSIAKMHKQMKLSDSIKGGIDRIQSVIMDIPEYFKLALHPVELAFLGKASLYEKEIEHGGGDLVLDVESAGRSVRLFSRDDLELGHEASDTTGFVRFEDIEKGRYKIIVDGFEITNIQRTEL